MINEWQTKNSFEDFECIVCHAIHNQEYKKNCPNPGKAKRGERRKVLLIELCVSCEKAKRKYGTCA